MNKNPLDELEETQKELIEQKDKLIKELKVKKNCCLGCLIPIFVIFIIFLGMSLYVSRLDGFKPLMKCVQNQYEIYNALSRYKDLNNTYPKDLSIIGKEYLKEPNNLYCPLDKKKKGYEYENPINGKKSYILRCPRHTLSNNIPIPPIVITKDGKFSYDFDYLNNKDQITNNK